jgi:hypothetical protein
MQSVFLLLAAAQVIAVLVMPGIQLRQEYVFLPGALEMDGVE